METKEYGWQDQLDVGAQGEEVVRQWLGREFWTVEDVRDRAWAQSRDIDFQVEREDTWLSVEVKTDSYDNDAAFLELYAGNATKPGALFKSRADVWYYWKPKRNYIIEFVPAQVAAAIARLDFHSVLKPVMNKDERTGKKRIASWGVRVTLEWLQQLPGTRVHENIQEVRDEAGASE